MRVLVILPCQPFPAYNGQTHRLALVARWIAKRHDVALACFVEPGQSVEPAQSDRQLFTDMRVVPIEPVRSAAAILAQRLSRDPSDVHRYRSDVMARHVSELASRLDPEVVLIGDPGLVNYLAPFHGCILAMDYVCEMLLQMDRMAALASPLERPLWMLRRNKFARFLKRIEPLFDVVFLNSAEDVDSLARVWPRHKLVHVPNGLDLEEYPLNLAPPTRDRLIYPGSIAYPPNRDAVEWFATEIFPSVHAERPQTELRVTGAKPVDGSAPEAEKLIYTGRVPDVRKEIAAAWATVVPLRLGAGGARFKVIESLALGTPLVGTAIGIEGMTLVDGKEYLHAETPRQFAAACLKLLNDQDFRNQVANAGRKRMEMSYDWNVLFGSIEENLKRIPRKTTALAS